MKVKINNKNLKMILIVAAVTVVALGVLLLLISGNEDRNKVPTNPTDTAQATEGDTSQPSETETTSAEEKTASETARTLFAAKVESMEDSTAIAKLLETIDLKKNVASYMVDLQPNKSPKSMTITFDKTISEDKRKSFDNEMQKYAEQILSLVTDVEEVQWAYNVKAQGSKAKKVTVFLNVEDATTLLNANVKQYGESAATIQTLLDQQKGH